MVYRFYVGSVKRVTVAEVQTGDCRVLHLVFALVWFRTVWMTMLPDRTTISFPSDAGNWRRLPVLHSADDFAAEAGAF